MGEKLVKQFSSDAMPTCVAKNCNSGHPKAKDTGSSSHRVVLFRFPKKAMIKKKISLTSCHLAQIIMIFVGAIHDRNDDDVNNGSKGSSSSLNRGLSHMQSAVSGQ